MIQWLKTLCTAQNQTALPGPPGPCGPDTLPLITLCLPSSHTSLLAVPVPTPGCCTHSSLCLECFPPPPQPYHVSHYDIITVLSLHSPLSALLDSEGWPPFPLLPGDPRRPYTYLVLNTYLLSKQRPRIQGVRVLEGKKWPPHGEKRQVPGEAPPPAPLNGPFFPFLDLK